MYEEFVDICHTFFAFIKNRAVVTMIILGLLCVLNLAVSVTRPLINFLLHSFPMEDCKEKAK